MKTFKLIADFSETNVYPASTIANGTIVQGDYSSTMNPLSPDSAIYGVQAISSVGPVFIPSAYLVQIDANGNTIDANGNIIAPSTTTTASTSTTNLFTAQNLIIAIVVIGIIILFIKFKNKL